MSMSDASQPNPCEKQGYGETLGPALYAAGGFFVNVKNLAVVTRLPVPPKHSSGVVIPVFEGTIGNGAAKNAVKVKCFDPLTGAEAINGTVLNTVTFGVTAVGF